MNPAALITILIMVGIALIVAQIMLVIAKTANKISTPWWAILVPLYLIVLDALFLYFYTQGA